ncbi:MAG: hypothetical protein M3440_12935 [Chloroflexota bacterium]|nr:hypothetical protein [Chloroflexota bacterium]
MANNTSGQPDPEPKQTRWDRFLYWSRRFHESPVFDENERDYKLVVASRLQGARSSLFNDDPLWFDELHHAITAKPNNLTNWRATRAFETWCRAEPETAKLALRLLWNEDTAVAKRFDQFAEVVATSGQNVLIAEASFFHMAVDPHAFPMFRATPVDRAMALTNYAQLKEVGIKPDELGRRYEHFLWFLDVMIKRAANGGLHLRDRLDAQSAAWVVTQWSPLDDWSEADKQAFLAYQGEAALRKDSWGEPKKP